MWVLYLGQERSGTIHEATTTTHRSGCSGGSHASCNRSASRERDERGGQHDQSEVVGPHFLGGGAE